LTGPQATRTVSKLLAKFRYLASTMRLATAPSVACLITAIAPVLAVDLPLDSLLRK
jgi:hypothetical protein